VTRPNRLLCGNNRALQRSVWLSGEALGTQPVETAYCHVLTGGPGNAGIRLEAFMVHWRQDGLCDVDLVSDFEQLDHSQWIHCFIASR